MHLTRLAVVASGLASLLACDGVPGGNAGDALTVTQATTTTDRNGTWSMTVDVPDGVDHFQITGVGKRDEIVFVEEVYDPSGDRVVFWRDWWDSNYSLSNAIYGDPVAAFDWPSRAQDGKLSPGTWEIVGSLVRPDYYYATNSGMTLYTAKKQDGDFSSGDVAVRIVWADGIQGDAEVVDAVEQAVERWRDVWGGAGVTLTERYVDSNLDADLAFAWYGDDPAVARVAEGKRMDELQLVVGEQVAGSRGTYGVSGGIPGTIASTGSSYVVISWLTHAGGNASFDADEIRLMGETMAHEVGHYAGLFHPVENSNNGPKAWDALDDTDECSTWSECERELGTNVMYPYSICGGGSCLATDVITDDQSGVMQRYVGTL